MNGQNLPHSPLRPLHQSVSRRRQQRNEKVARRLGRTKPQSVTPIGARRKILYTSSACKSRCHNSRGDRRKYGDRSVGRFFGLLLLSGYEDDSDTDQFGIMIEQRLG
jgi:hypothetical protein